jgi:arylsulfatase A-like enzyme
MKAHAFAFAALLVDLAAAGDAVRGAEEFNRPNIVLCMADDQGWGDVGFRGHSVVKTDRYSQDSLPGNAAWIDGKWKLHRKAGKAGESSYALFDLEADPREQTDLAAEQPERLKSLRDELEAWQKSVVRSLNGEDYSNER